MPPTATPTPTATLTPTPTPTPTATPTSAPHLFDPPTGFKSGLADHWPVVTWRQVWINDSNTAAVRVWILDPLAADTAYIPGSLTCEARGASSTDVCQYDAAQRRIVWQGTIAPDPGTTDETTAANAVVLTFRVRALGAQNREVSNQSTAHWDENGDGRIDRSDPNVALGRAAHARASARRPALPNSGFAPAQQSRLPRQPDTVRYAALGHLWLEIPRLGVQAPIVGVPRRDGTWPVDWLGNRVGWLEGTAFPTWQGNSVLTAHVYLADGLPGPFVGLSALRWGDQIVIRTEGWRFVYRVQSNRVVAADDGSALFHKTGDWLTLVTCRGYDPRTQTYRWRQVVQAVRIDAVPER